MTDRNETTKNGAMDIDGARRALIGLQRPIKRVVIVVNDLLCLSLALWLVLSVRMNAAYWPETLQLALILAAAPVLGVITLGWFGAYRLVTRYFGADAVMRVFASFALSILLWGLLIILTGIGLSAFGYGTIPRSTSIAYFITGSAFLFGSRTLAAWMLHGIGLSLPHRQRHYKSVVIYGAGAAGMQVRDALMRSGGVRVAAFFDDERSLWGQYLGGTKVYPPDPLKIARVIEREGAREIILAVPHLERRVQQDILRQLQSHTLRVQILPSLVDLASGRVTVSDLRPVQVSDLLGRDPVPADAELLARCIEGKSVLVTGAGGSIGAELVRQIARQQPARIVLLEASEPALYDIQMELSDWVVADASGGRGRIDVVPVLGSVLNVSIVERAIRGHGIHTVFHAAAYKHVPLVEANPAAGLENNVFGTEVVASVARASGVERFVLISTDKAVRPTNIMGASKRLAELVIQAHAADPTCGTIFTMVRFGNVLDSSGSVVRRFRKQIEAGGPITVTHPDVTRYFMSIPEAAELVLQAGAMAEGGDVFLLEMGEPVKIDELARTMVQLVGLEVRDEANRDGDIEIIYTGLRPGEKLYEELLIEEGAVRTAHPRILRHSEAFLDMTEVRLRLDALRVAIAGDDRLAIGAVLRKTVEGYQPTAIGDAPFFKTSHDPLSRRLH